MNMRRRFVLVVTFWIIWVPAQYGLTQITRPEECLGFKPGADFHLATYEQAIACYQKWASQTGRMKLFVISGDTAPTPAIAENCNGCDVLIHEVYHEAGFLKRPPAWQKYHSNYHTSSRELGEIATKARPGLLILYHQLFWGASDEDLLGDVRRVYAGKVVSGRDLDVF